ncbi:hypothetical protein Clacol_000471 [Clathrus columnatus]|uniref:Amino acid transporter transmembrane domain-containing protein n=1 Tax=Clathrus columnatus TaxID=1419009 RepID=A0AAV5A325_9AGAM|nr:hypothetical protein Clacol_000471 [Clathrus columnatus]
MTEPATKEISGTSIIDSGDETVSSSPSNSKSKNDVFGDEEGHQVAQKALFRIKFQILYKTLSWQFVGFLMIAEIVSNGMLSLPSALATVAVFLIVFLGVFALFTAKLLIDFKLNHPEVHSEAGFILFGPIGREVLSLGTVIFSVFATGSEILSGQQTLTELTNGKLCATYFILIFSFASFFMALPRTLNQLTWLGAISCISILTAGVVGMIGAGINPTPDRVLSATIPQSFTNAFLAITNPVFAYAVWAKVALALALPNFLIGGGLYTHVPAKLIYVRIFRNRDRTHIHSHTLLGWAVWSTLCFTLAALAFIFCVAVPIFSFLIGLAASLFASWFTYGIAGFFGLHDIYYLQKGVEGLKRNKWMLLVDAYRDHEIPAPFTC